jgi:dTDP-4-dehydrorhamnose reductase
MTLRLLVFGHTGQVATALRRLEGPDLSVHCLSRAEADLADPAACEARIWETDAHVVVNAAAYTAVDKAEADEARAHAVNAVAPGRMAVAAASRDLPFLHISTDYVFDGSGTRPWCEDDPVAPLCAYGRTKLAGEQAVIAAAGPHAVLRTAWVFSPYGTNFVKSMLHHGAVRDRLTVVDDQYGGPTPAESIAEALVTIAQAFAAGRGTSGVFHFSGAPAVSWFGFAREIFKRTNWPRLPEIAPITTADWQTPAQRPANSRLDCSRITQIYGLNQPDWRTGLDCCLAALAAGET